MQLMVVIRALTALAADGATVVDIVVFIIIAVVVVATASVVAGHGPVPVAAATIVSTVGGELTVLMTDVVVIFISSIPEHHGPGFLAWEDKRVVRWCFLNNNFLWLGGLLPDNDGSGCRVGLGIILGFFAIALDIMAMSVLKLLFHAALDPDVIAARAAIPVTVAVSGFEGDTAGAVRLTIALDVPFVYHGAGALAALG